jgi:translocation protein SEC66
MIEIDWRGLILPLVLPLAYVVVIVGSLITFSSVYRKRKAAKSAGLAPWFPPHMQKNIYLSLLHIQPGEGKEKSIAVPDSVVRAALLKRAVEDIHRIIQIRAAKQACSSLLARGSVGDDLWQRFLRAEKEMEEELRDVVLEANALAPNWGQTIFQSANEIAANNQFRKRLEEIQSNTKPEKEWWEKRRASIQADFMKELDETPSSAPVKLTHVSKTGSDEDAILVEAGGPTASAASSEKGSMRRKKGKKSGGDTK